MARIISRAGPEKAGGNGSSAMAETALPSTTTALASGGGGMELWPPFARAVTRSVP
jgi:hypothetical protein